MRKFNLVLAVLGLVLTLHACAPSEDVNPQTDSEKLEKFDVKSTGGADGQPAKPNPK